VEKMLKDHRDKVSHEDALTVERALESTRKAMQGNDVEEINKAVDALTQASHKLAEAMYKASSAAPGDAGAPGAGDAANGAKPAEGAAKKDDVVDAEFVDVDDKDKK